MNIDKIEPIAIVGINLKFPGDADSPQAFWQMLLQARNVATEAPGNRFNIDGFYHPDPARLDAIRVRKAHYMNEDPRAFDAPFFTMSPAEASIVDPQQRCLLEGTYRTLENAGLRMDQVAGTKTSVYCASFARDQDTIFARDPEYQSRYQATATGYTLLSNRISHFFDLRGPSLTVDTACSSGLYAFHLACQSILSGESDMSLVCGASTCLTPEGITVVLDNAGFLSPDGRCFSFDHRANGYGRGEGFGFLLLKPLRTALRDGDCIRAVVRGTGANQDGRTPSLTQPSSEAQERLIRATYERAGLALNETEFVEAHGTGTLVGDPIEARGIGSVFRPHRSQDRPLYVGSVKSNIGHLEGASGIAGLMKLILALEKGVIPPNADFEKVNSDIDLDDLCLKIPDKAVPWPSSGLRRASVSSFGYGGSNAHAVLDDAHNYLRSRGLAGVHQTVDLSVSTNGITNGATNDTCNGTTTNGYHKPKTYPIIIPLSAQDKEGPKRQAAALEAHLARLEKTPPGDDEASFLLDLTHTLCTRRSLLNWRSTVVVDSLSEASTSLAARVSESAFTLESKCPTLSFVFTGQGAQHARMAVGLLRYPVFRRALEDCDVHLAALGCRWSVLDELQRDETSSRVHLAELSQPLCTAVQIALADLLGSWDIRPKTVCGHSSGEIAAAYCAGALTRESAWAIAYFRGLVASRLISDTTPQSERTTMMSVGLGEDEVVNYLEDGATVACVNSPMNTTVVGPVDVIEDMHARLDREGIFAKKLAVDIGYHSSVMRQGAAEYEALLMGHIKAPAAVKQKKKKDTCESARVAMFFSSVSGDAINDMWDLRDAKYWVNNLVSPVRFASALTALVSNTTTTTTSSKKDGRFLVEIGPSPGLRRPIQDTVTGVLGKRGGKWHYASALPQPQPTDTDINAVQMQVQVTSLLDMVGQLWREGLDINLEEVNRSSILDNSNSNKQAKLLVDLPSYPFSRATWYWDEGRLSRNFAFRPHRRHALLGIRDQDWNAGEAGWRHQLRVTENPWLRDHALNGSPIFPGSGMLVMAVEAARQLAQGLGYEDRISGYRLDSVRMLRPIDIDADAASERGTEARIHLRPRKALLSGSDQMPWYDFRIYAMSGEEWVECAFGGVKVELVSEQLPDEQKEAARTRLLRFGDSLLHEYSENAKRCMLTAHSKQFYRNISKKSGFDYGPYFQLLRDISYDRAGHVTASLPLREYAEHMQFAAEDPCVIHPTTLDALCQAHMVGLSKGGWHRIPTMMFTHLGGLWLSHKLFTTPGNPALRVASRETMRGFRECVVRTVALFADTMTPAVVVDGQRGTAITSLHVDDAGFDDDDDDMSHMAFGVRFQPRPSLLTMAEIKQYLNRTAAARDAQRNLDDDYAKTDRSDAIMLHYAQDMVRRLDAEPSLPWDDQHFFGRYLNFLRSLVANEKKWALSSRRSAYRTVDELLRDAHLDPGQRLNKHVGEHLYGILSGREDALQVIFADDRVDAFYHSELTSALNRRIGAYVALLSHVNPRLRILEVGAGTGSSTAKILPHLVHDLGNGRESVRFGEYMYTDISAAFFEKARERFASVVGPMNFKRLDIEAEVTQQGFQEGYYDVVIAGNVLHATADPDRALRNCRRLLRPGGSLCLAELTNLDAMRHVFVFGLLPGWWLRPHAATRPGEKGTHTPSDDYDTCGSHDDDDDDNDDDDNDVDQGPLLSEKQWDVAFRDAGFMGLQMSFRDFDDALYHQVSILITTVPEEDYGLGNQTQEEISRPLSDPPDTLGGPCVILIDASSSLQQSLAKEIQNGLELKLGSKCRTVTLEHFANNINDNANNDDNDSNKETSLGETTIISLPELTRPLLAEATAAEFASIKKLSTRCKLLLWLTTGASPMATNPDAEVSVGFGRTVCSERADQCFVNLSLERPFEEPLTRTAETVIRVLRDALMTGDATTRETEYTEVDGLVCVPRLVPAGHINDALVARSRTRELETYVIGAELESQSESKSTETKAKPHVYLTIASPGLLDTLYYTEDADADEPLKPQYCEVEIKVAGLNFRDVMIALGGVPGDSFGCDGAGVVSRVGPGVGKFKPGDRVICCSNDGKGFGTYARYLEQDLTLMPEGMSFQVAAAISAVWRTVVYALDYIARLSEGQSVLIHSAAGGVGQAAIQLAQLRRADIFVTVGSESKRELVKELYGIPDSRIFYSRDSSFQDDVLHATGRRGVDVVLNCLSGELLQHSWDCIAPLGCFVDIGKGDALLNNALPMAPFSRNVSFACVDLSLVSRVSPPLMTRIMADVLRLFAAHPHLRESRPLHVYAPAQAEEAFRYVQSGRNTGKVLVDYETPGHPVAFRPALRPAYAFRPDATYVLSGGLGGLGREITRWMVGRGARYLLLLNRRGAVGLKGSDRFLAEVEGMGMGVRVWAPACDVCDRLALGAVLREASLLRGFPPVKGCIQGAMVLNDDMVANMSAEQFHNAVRPKRAASWNLHELLPRDMDFFVMLSSFCGMFGNPGQSNYAAGGTYEDALARHRVAQGLRAVSIDLGLVAEAGWANDNYERVASNLRTYGGVHNEQLMALLDLVCDPAYQHQHQRNKNDNNSADMDMDMESNAHVVTIMDRPSQIFGLTVEGRIVWPTKPLFRHLLRIGEAEASASASQQQQQSSAGSTVDYMALARAASTVDEAAEVVVQGLLEKLAKSLSVAPESLDAGKPAYALGVDSLIAVEIRYWFTKHLAVEIPVFTIMKNQSVWDLCLEAAQKVLDQQQPPPPQQQRMD